MIVWNLGGNANHAGNQGGDVQNQGELRCSSRNEIGKQ